MDSAAILRRAGHKALTPSGILTRYFEVAAVWWIASPPRLW
jgi:hypothetical protein